MPDLAIWHASTSDLWTVEDANAAHVDFSIWIDSQIHLLESMCHYTSTGKKGKRVKLFFMGTVLLWVPVPKALLSMISTPAISPQQILLSPSILNIIAVSSPVWWYLVLPCFFIIFLTASQGKFSHEGGGFVKRLSSLHAASDLFLFSPLILAAQSQLSDESNLHLPLILDWRKIPSKLQLSK